MMQEQPIHPEAHTPSMPDDPMLRLLDRPLTAADLEAGAAMAALPAETRSVRSVRYLLFRIGHEIAALPAGFLRRVTPAARAVPIPHRTTETLRGVCNVRGELVLCIDLCRLIGLATPSDDDAQTADQMTTPSMIVFGPSDNAWAFEVSELLGIENIDSATIREAPLTIRQSIADFTIGVIDRGNQCVSLLDGERILAACKATLA